MNRNTKQYLTLGAGVLAGILLFPAKSAHAEVKLAEGDDWELSTDGRVNAFVSHVFGDNRPPGAGNLEWVGFNESSSPGATDEDGKIRTTRIRSGYVPTTVALNFRGELNDDTKVSARVEIGIQITNQQVGIPDAQWMEPRAAWFDVQGGWGSVRLGRDLGLFGRKGLLMNYDLGHGYGLGFPCAYVAMFSGACGHVGFGALWPDFKAQITYSTPKLFDVIQLNAGVLDPRAVPNYEWDYTPTPRAEALLTATVNISEGLGFEAWGDTYYQTVGTNVEDDVTDPVTQMPTGEKTTRGITKTAFGVGGGIVADVEPLHLGFSGHQGKGLDAFTLLTFNPIAVSQGDPNQDKREFRQMTAFLVQARGNLGKSLWLTAGYGKTLFDRLPAPIDPDPLQPNAFAVPRSHTGVSAGAFYRIGRVVLGVDYFNAHYDFDARAVTNPAGAMLPPIAEDIDQTVHVFNAGGTLEW